MNMKRLYEISGEIKVKNNLSTSRIQEQFISSLKKEGVEKIIRKEGYVEFQPNIIGKWAFWSPWQKNFISGGSFEVSSMDTEHRTIRYKLSLIQYFYITIVLSSFIWLFELNNITLPGIHWSIMWETLSLPWISVFILIFYGLYRGFFMPSMIRSFIKNACDK